MAKAILSIVNGSLALGRCLPLFASMTLVALACSTADDDGALVPSGPGSGSPDVLGTDTSARDAAVATMSLDPPPSGSTEGGGGDPLCIGNPPDQPSRCALFESAGVPFATEVHPFTDGVSNARLRNPEPGKVCLQGTMVERGTAAISFVVTNIESDSAPYAIVPFDLQALDISALEFTLTSAPSGGVSVELLAVERPQCSADFDCVGPALPLGGTTPSLFASGPVRLKMTDFTPAEPGPRLVWAFHFSGHSVAGANYDFCLEDLRFFNSRGELVSPPAAGAR